jgi:hypothetical protein
MKLKLYILVCFLSIFQVSLAIEKMPKTYSLEESKALGLQPVILPNGEVIMPTDNGENLRIDLNPSPVAAEVTPEQIVKVMEDAKRVGSVVNDILSFQINGKIPLVIQKTIGGVIYEILLEQLIFTPSGNTLSIKAMITTQDGKHICFYGQQIGFTGQGGIKEGTLTLALGEKNSLKFDKLKNIDLELISGKLVFGCNGYESFSLAGNVIFDRKLIVPDNVLTGDVAAGNVKSAFKLIDIRSWNDILMEIDMQPFQLPSMPGYGFEVSHAVIDISDSQNTGNFSFPKEYTAAEDGPMWQGVYIGNVSIRFPKHFKTRSGPYAGGRVRVGVNDLLIDRFGVSGEVFGENIFSSKDGDLNGWDYSLTGASIILVKSKVKAGSLMGEMRVAVAGETQMMGYKAIIDPTRDYYNFTVTSGEQMDFEFLKASKVSLEPASTVSLTLDNKEFMAKANLHGSLNIGSDDYGITLEKFTFQNLKLSTKAPYLTIGYFGGGSGREYSVANFPVSFNGPVINAFDGGVNVTFGINLTMDKMGISAKGGFLLEGEFVNENNRHFWKNKQIGIKKLSVSADINQFFFDGTVDFFKNDPVYGKGFYGELKFGTRVGPFPDVSATAAFGREKGKDSYWFVDAELNMYPGGGSGLQLTMLAGCVYKKMRPAPGLAGGLKTVSGVAYKPDYSIGWGARFGAGLRIGGGEKAVSGAAGLEFVAKDGGGIQSFGLMGIVSVAGDPEQHSKEFILDSYRKMCNGDEVGRFSSPPVDAAKDKKDECMNLFPAKSANGMSGSIILKFNFDEKTFMGRVGMEGKSDKVQFAFMGAFYFSPNKWYIHLGEPPMASRIKIKVPSIIPRFDGYFMFGHGLIGLPEPIPNIFESTPSLAGERSSGISNDKGIDGSGFAFGIAAELSSQGGYKQILTYKALVRVGLDMLIVNYGPGVTCFGYNGPIGLNGWLAQGQLYAVGGIQCEAFKIPVLSIQLGALLKGTAPNPTSGSGQVALKFKVLTKKYDFKMGFEVGDACKLALTEEKSEDISVFKTIFPADGSTSVDYKTEPYVQFTEKVDETIKSDELDVEFRIKVVSYTLKNSKGESVKGSWDVKNSDKTKLLFNSKDDLEGNMEYTANAIVKYEKKEGGSWVPIALGGAADNTYTFKFKTAKTPKQIKDENDAAAAAAAAKAKAESEYKTNLAAILASQSLREKAEADYRSQLNAVDASTKAEIAKIEAAATEAKRQLDEINANAAKQGEDIKNKSKEEADAIKAENKRKADDLNRMIAEANASAEQKREAQRVADAARAAADEAARQAEAHVKHIVDQAVNQVHNVTANAKNEVDNVKNSSQFEVQRLGDLATNNIKNLAYAKQAKLTRIANDLKAELDAVRWPYKKRKRREIREKYRISAQSVRNDYDVQINAIPGPCSDSQKAISDNAKAQMDAIVVRAKQQADAIMANAASQSQEAMNRARDTANAIMANAENQCRGILGGGLAIGDTNGFAEALKAQNNAFDESFNEDDNGPD